MRNRLTVFVLCLLALGSAPAGAQVTIQIGVPDVRIDYRVETYPYLVRVPNYPVYYAPRLHANYFFYDGLYWVYRRGNWYASYWYDGPWALIEPHEVPVYVLRIPVRYYRDPPQRFASWRADAPPRWVEVWGPTWEQQRIGWDRWDRYAVPAIAPLPTYQRQYVGSRYPRLSEQAVLQSRYYTYQPRDVVARQFYVQQGVRRTDAAVTRQQAREQQRARATAYASEPRVKEMKVKEVKVKEHKVKEPKYKEAKVKESKHREVQVREQRFQEPRYKEAKIKEPKQPKQAKVKEPKHQEMRIAEFRDREPRFHEQRGGGHEMKIKEPKPGKEFKEPKGGGKEHKEHKEHKGK